MATFLVAHGAWSAGWAWKKMRPLMRAAGHELWTPTYTGVGERAHMARPDIDLDTHIADVLGVLHCEDLRDVALIGHSYGGMVATGVAARARDRIARLIYLDAFAPKDGQALLDLVPAEQRERITTLVQSEGQGYLVPPNPMPPDTSEADLAWAAPRRVFQPVGTMRQKLALTGGPLTLPVDYIYALRHPDYDVFGQFAARARTEANWRLHEIDASHNPHITCPQVLMALLARIIAS
jgi:pimeloyl-ACP methyl ester carboxylesterase